MRSAEHDGAPRVSPIPRGYSLKIPRCERRRSNYSVGNSIIFLASCLSAGHLVGTRLHITAWRRLDRLIALISGLCRRRHILAAVLRQEFCPFRPPAALH